MALPELAEVVDGEVVDGEIVDDEAAVSRPPSVVLAVVVRPVEVIKVVAKHDHTRTAGRHLMYIPLGALVAARRVWDSRSTARYERFIRAAESAGNHEAALDWEKQRAQFIKDRHARRADMIELPLKVLLAIPKIALGMFIVLAVLGIFMAIGTKHFGEIIAPFKAVADIVEWVTLAVAVTWGPVVLALPWIAAGLAVVARPGACQREYDRLAVPRKNDDDTGLVVTADTIVLALQNLDKTLRSSGPSRTAGGRPSTRCRYGTDAATRRCSVSRSA